MDACVKNYYNNGKVKKTKLSNEVIDGANQTKKVAISQMYARVLYTLESLPNQQLVVHDTGDSKEYFSVEKYL